MRIRQLSVFSGNEAGRLAEVLRPLAAKQINIQAMSVADHSDYGIVRMVVSDTEAAFRALHEAKHAVRVDEVLAYEIPHIPGGLMKAVVEPLAQARINLEYFYAFVGGETGKAMVVLKVSDPEMAEKVLGKG